MNKIINQLLSLSTVLILLTSGCNEKVNKNSNQEFITENGQVGIELGGASTLAGKIATIDNIDYFVKTGIKENITVHFESLGVNPNYKNSIIVNNKVVHTIDKNKTTGTYNFTSNSFPILGLNATKGKMLEITFKAGGLNNYNSDSKTENIDDFSIRNVYLTINNDSEIWSNQYNKVNYENYSIQFCEGDVSKELRANCNLTKTFTFSIPNQYFNVDGILINTPLQSDKYYLKINNQTSLLEYNQVSKIKINIDNNEVISDNRIITLNSSLNLKSYEAYLDGTQISLPFTLNKGYWSNGNHSLIVLTEDIYGNQERQLINFVLDSEVDLDNQVNYNAYNYGPLLELPTNIPSNGVEINTDATLNKDGNYLSTGFGNNSIQTYLINNAKIGTPVRWVGKAPKNKPLVLYVYNHNLELWDALSTNENKIDNEVTLAAFINDIKYIKDNQISVMVACIENKYAAQNIDSRILWISDTQHLTETTEFNTGLSAIGDWVVANANKMNVKYIMHTGDMVQLNSDLQQWENSHSLLISKLISTNIPFGISSGNHDIGAITTSCKEGIQCMNENLDYSNFYSYYQDLNTSGNILNNHSSYNLVTINDNNFLFLHLGWGSTISGIHVTEQDTVWANSVLKQYNDRIAIITSHDYLKVTGKKSTTGNYIFDNIVTKNPNVKMVLAGHNHASVSLIENIDDNNDAVGDRQVIQVLTDFQDDDFGPTYFRLLNMDKQNNRINFQTYSPYFQDYNAYDPGIYTLPTISEFNIHFNLNAYNYGLETDYFG